MKIYLASDQKQLGIRIANMINRSGNTCIMSDEDSEDQADLVSDVKNAYASYDVSILIASNPHDAAIAANKYSGIRATVCKDPEDAAAAMAAKSNLIVMDGAKISANIRDILKSVFDSFETEPATPQQQKKERLPATQPQASVPMNVSGSSLPVVGGMLGSIKGALGVGNAQPPQQKPQQKAPAPQPQPKAKVQQKVQQPTPQPQQKKKGKGGFFDSIKDAFGVD